MSNLAPISKSFLPLLYDDQLKNMNVFNYGAMNQNDNLFNAIAEHILKLDFNFCYHLRGDMRRVLSEMSNSLIRKINRRSKEIRAEIYASILPLKDARRQIATPAIYLTIHQTNSHKQYQIAVTSTGIVKLA